MSSSGVSNTLPGSNRSKAVRKKAPEACERCREKRIKCNGLQPCDQCVKKEIQCVFAFSPLATESAGNKALVEKLDLVLSRLDRIEEEMGRQASSIASVSGQATKQQQHSCERRSSGVAQLNQQTECFEYYGQTSTFMIASSLGKRLRQLEDASDSSAPAKQRLHHSNPERLASRDESSRSLGLDELTGFCDYVIPLNALRSDRYLRDNIADRHIDSFFQTIHVLLPILDPVAFRARYGSLRQLFGDRRLFLATTDDPRRPQFACLLYAVLALGALYEDEQEDSSSWASWYFAEAQDMLGRLLNASNLQLVQATLLGAYAQHAIKPNLAYILNGVATRLAFSIGLNVESLHYSFGFDVEEAKRTWWIIYIQEVELSLDSGRPMYLRPSEMIMNYPTTQPPSSDELIPESAQVGFIRYLAEIAKVIWRILKLFAESDEQSTFKLEQKEALRHELERWRASLPTYLVFEDLTHAARDNYSSLFLHNWKERQKSSLRIHYNLANIILLRSSVTKKASESYTLCRQPLYNLHQSSYWDAARDMIRHIYSLFALAPGLRRWSYYCFYCLHATLVILPKVADDYHRSRHRQQSSANDLSNPQPSVEVDRRTSEEDRRLCRLAIDIFDQIELKASQRCADVVRQFLDKWTRPRPEKNRTGSDALQTSSSLDHRGMQQVSSSTRPISALEPSTASLLTLERPVISNDDGGGASISTGTGRGRPSGTESVCSVDGSSSTSPVVSLNGLQAELYDAFYGNGLDDGFDFGQQPCFFGAEVSGNGALELGMDGSWHPHNAMLSGDGCLEPGWSIE
ncbi:fungal-specific transcription factor domain-containing protein [Dactylonectria macrodidyma]|uniref:Fungal-specific transcription factor domain-containing protein n=1 Tax=Dactylonectria macrodidyma TaxID=307937 RepID=A0A9P9I7E8_9HYPO|nr:fungal-specific transcription factor domain-containing protein [Dactylonectria macrodidyma]